MRIAVNGVRLFVDIVGAGLVPDGPVMRKKPTLMVLHGGPGADHSIYRPAFDRLSDLCQVIYVDHRGYGRSDDSDPDHWTLAQWRDDVQGLCQMLGIARAIIFGASFGGYAAQSFATRHPDNTNALILACTAAHVDFERIYAAFAQVGGPEAGQIARTFWSDPTPERRQACIDACLPLYSVTPTDPDVMAGDRDPIMPRAFSDEIAHHMPGAQYHVLENAGHLLEHDAPEAFFGHIHQFITEYSHAA